MAHALLILHIIQCYCHSVTGSFNT